MEDIIEDGPSLAVELQRILFKTKIMEMDWLGTLLNTGVYTSWAIVLTFGGSECAWGDGRTIATFVVFGVTFVAFFAQQYFAFMTTYERRIFPGEFLKSRTLMLLFVCTNTAGAAILIVVYYIPVYFQFVHGDNGLMAAVRLLPFVFM